MYECVCDELLGRFLDQDELELVGRHLFGQGHSNLINRPASTSWHRLNTSTAHVKVRLLNGKFCM